MNKEELNRLLDHIYELEGLVHLALVREDCPESLPELIVRKSHALGDMICEIESSESEETIDNDSQIRVAPDEEVTGVEEEESAVEDNLDASAVEIIPEADAGKSIGDAIDVAGYEMSDRIIISDDDEIEETAFASYTLPVEEPSEPVAPVSKVDDEWLSQDEKQKTFAGEQVALSSEFPRKEDMNKGRQQVVGQKAERFGSTQKVVEPRGKLVFTINDRYRFKRDLFCNSDAEFNTTLALVASMDSYEEAEDYFLDELQWSLQREEVMDFLEILKNYFK